MVLSPAPSPIGTAKSQRLLGLLSFFTLATIPSVIRAASPEEIAFFETKIRPVLAEKCYSCHSAKSEKLKAGLQLDHIDYLLNGGDSGPAIVAGDPGESLLIETIHYGNPDLQMPPKGKLAAASIADFEKWIAMGAPWPEETKPVRKAGATKVDGSDAVMEAFDLEKRRSTHWCWQPIHRPKVPAVSLTDWPRKDLDRFVLAKLEANGLRPAEAAAPETWLRRVHFDLIGLPPSPEELTAFLDNIASAGSAAEAPYTAVVERLLASPHFGERWARHWMDLARFGETCGHEFDYPIPNAFRYRDYLIDAFNRDLPFDQFLVEHLAGDLLPDPRRDPGTGIDQSIVATGFWFLHEAVHAPTDILGDESGRIDNQIDVFSKSFLGLTVACARCHDHKFDAISTADYYSMAGYLQSSRRQEAFLDPNQSVAKAATEARRIHERGQTLLPNAFAMAGDPGKNADQLARYLSAADELLAATKRITTKANPAAFADFESGYGDWTVEGDAFGSQPARGTFKGQQTVSGFLGSGLVNTWNGSDSKMGRALSPVFTIEKPYLHFLIGGGAHKGRTCVNLLIHGKTVLSATGKNNEALSPTTWDLFPYRGKQARLEIVDEAAGGWGHVNVDHFVFSEEKSTDPDQDSQPPLDPALARQIATQQGLIDDSTLLHWAEVIRSPASDDPSHPLFLWKASAKDPGAAKKFGQKWEDQAKAFEAALKETELLADFDSGDAEGWTSTGFSFDAAPTKSPEWTPGTDGGLVTPAGVLTSAELTARFHGVLRSPTFELTRNSIHLRLRSRAAEVRLVIDGHYMNRFHQLLLKGTILKTGDTDTKGEFRWLTMTGDVNKYVGHRVYLEISDLSGGFVELDEVRLSDAPLPPEPPRLGRTILARKGGDSRAELANAYGATWADGVTSLQNQKAAPAQAAWLDFVWREQLWPRNPDLEETARAMTQSNPPEPLFATAMLDGTPENERVHIRGSHLKLGDTVPRQNLTALGGSLAPETASGRLELARELVSKDNPLVRRVAVNRVWHHLFERGIVPTVDDFGVMGQPPSHPELLDWLATEFSDSMNWSLKRLLREIVLSGTYRMSSAPHPSLDRERLAVVDPGNVLLHRAPIRRLQAEAIRDAILTVSGRLDPAVGGPSVPVHLTSFMEGRGRPKESGPLDGAGRRSLYTEIRRNFLPPFLLTFDMPIPFNAMGRRSVSNVPAQALSLLNDPFVVEEAALWAEHITADASVSMNDRVVRLFQAAYCRRPTDEERQQIESFLASEPDQKQAWSDLCHTLFNKKEFIYLN